MKKWLVGVMTLMCLNSAFYAEAASLRMKIAGPIKDNRYFLCVSGVGCVSIFNGNKGHIYPLEPGHISSIYSVNASNMSYRIQNLPTTCNVTVNRNQILMISGRIVEGPNHAYSLNNLQCTVR